MNGYCDHPMTGVYGCHLREVEQCPDCIGEFCKIHSIRCEGCGLRICESDIDTHELNCGQRKPMQGVTEKDSRRKKA